MTTRTEHIERAEHYLAAFRRGEVVILSDKGRARVTVSGGTLLALAQTHAQLAALAPDGGHPA